MLAVTCSLKVVVGVSKVCQVSQLYPAINDLHGYRRAGINDAIPCSHCRLLLFFFSWAWAQVLFLFFFFLLSLGVEYSCSIIQGRQMECSLSFIYLCMYSFIADWYLFSACQIFKGCSWTGGKMLKKYIKRLAFDLILYYRVTVRAHFHQFWGHWAQGIFKSLQGRRIAPEIVAKFLMPAVTKSQRSQLGAAL